MKKYKKIIIPILLVVVLSLVAFFIVRCSHKDDIEDPVLNTKNVVSITASGYESEEVYQTYKYEHSSNVVITAHYTDDSYEVVTNECLFFTLNTSSFGTVEQRVQYIYNDKVVYCTYDVTVLELLSNYIELDYSNCKILYKKRETLDYSNLVVTAVFPNETRTKIKSYDISLFNEYGVVFKIDSPLTYVGRYTVTISYQDSIASYSINVYDDSLPSYSLPIDNLSSDEFPNNDLTNNTVLFNGPYISLVSKGVNSKFKYDTISYESTNYTKSLNITSDEDAEDFSGITFSTMKNTTVLMLINCNKNCLSFYEEDTNNSSNDKEMIEISGIKSGLGIVMFELGIGNFNLSSFGESIDIYEMTFIFEENISFSSYDNIEMDESLIKESYEFFDTINNDDLQVYGVINGNKELLNTNEYSVTIYKDNNKVSKFENEGNYDLVIKYTGDKLCYNRIIKKTITCVDTNNYSMYIKELYINGDIITTNVSQYIYEYYVKSTYESISLSFNLYSNKDYNITVNGNLYTESEIIELSLSENYTIIEIMITGDNLALGYSVVIFKYD